MRSPLVSEKRPGSAGERTSPIAGMPDRHEGTALLHMVLSDELGVRKEGSAEHICIVENRDPFVGRMRGRREAREHRVARRDHGPVLSFVSNRGSTASCRVTERCAECWPPLVRVRSDHYVAVTGGERFVRCRIWRCASESLRWLIACEVHGEGNNLE